jgi:hypothetical protein
MAEDHPHVSAQLTLLTIGKIWETIVIRTEAGIADSGTGGALYSALVFE